MTVAARRWVALLALVLCAVSGCASAVAGEATPEQVVGVTQTSDVRGNLDVTPLALVDPAPVYRESEYSSEPEEGTRLVAVRWLVTNVDAEDILIGPVGTTHFVGNNGTTYDDSLLETSAGAMFDQLRLSPRQSMVGFTTAEIPEDVTVDEVEFTGGFGPDDEVLTWKTAGQAVKEAPKPPPRRNGPATKPLGTGQEVEGTSDGDEFRLAVTPTKVTDPVEPRGQVYAEEDRRLLAVDLTVRNEGRAAYEDEQSDADLRIFAVHNAQDEAYTSHVYGAFADREGPLPPGAEAKWTIYFQVPTDFEVDRISFSPSFGRTVARIWTVT
ncbi:hypothetical protein CLV71_103136 [Actinophytocola oryzae]|uniref:DUF4352 domain-containing protein n=1 Tax=Actinophytocola oryzae TaxID=502181 RepID=A0A4R7VYQ2_9PSEU|nr:hypothetical protein CLV71_103136 [Actinophytocola oryzae]